MTEHYDALETRSPEEREAQLMAALPKQIALAKRRAPGFKRILRGIDPKRIDLRVSGSLASCRRRHPRSAG